MPQTQMAREIAEQPDAVRRTLDALLPRRDAVRALAADRRRVLLVARGSSDNAAVYGRYLLETHAGVEAAPAAPSVATHYRAPLDLRDSLVVSLSQSGATEEIVETQEWARERGAATLAVTNVADSPLAQQADLALVTRAGPELAVPATKSYLCPARRAGGARDRARTRADVPGRRPRAGARRGAHGCSPTHPTRPPSSCWPTPGPSWCRVAGCCSAPPSRWP